MADQYIALPRMNRIPAQFSNIACETEECPRGAQRESAMVLPANLNMRPGWRAEIERQIRAAKGNCYELDLFKQFLVSDLRQSCSGSLPLA